MTRANDRTLATTGGGFVKNGDHWHVTSRHKDGSLTAERLNGAGGRRGRGWVRLPAGYVAADVELAYATTAHRSQGGTVDTAHPVITDAMSREALYVLASRARHSTTLYVAADVQPDPALDHPTPQPRCLRDVLEQVLSQQAAELSATETIRRTLDEPHRLSQLVAAYEHAVDSAPAAVVTRHRAQLRDGTCGPLPPWIQRGVGDERVTGDQQRWTESLHERANQITARVAHLADQVQAAPPAWARHLPPPPDDPHQLQQWRHSIGLLAAYCEQYAITTSSDTALGTAPDSDQRRAHAHTVVTEALADITQQSEASRGTGSPHLGRHVSDYPARRPPIPTAGAGASLRRSL